MRFDLFSLVEYDGNEMGEDVNLVGVAEPF